MARFHISHLARADIDDILATSLALWGSAARRRYAALLRVAMQRAADQPEGPLTRDRSVLLPGLRSFHLRHARHVQPVSDVKQPVHVLYYQVVQPGVVEITRVLHERMEPSRHLGSGNGDEG